MAQAPSLWGNAIDGFTNALSNPLTLGGLSLLSGGDLNQGIAAGTQLQKQAQQQRQMQAFQQGIQGMPNLTDNDRSILSNSPELAQSVLGEIYKNRFDPMAGIRQQQAQNELSLFPLQKQQLQAEIANSAPKPQFTTIGHDAYGNATYGWVNPRAQTVTPANVPGAQPDTGASAETPPSGPTGADYLKTLPKPVADQVKAISEGRIPIPGGFALKTPYWQQRMMMVSQYDPSFDATNYASRAATRKDFTSGKSAQNITSFNTAIGHLGELDKSIDALGNSDYTTYNQINNAAAGPMGNRDRQVALKNFNVARNAVKEELTRAFKGTAGSLAEVEDWNNQINEADSPAALHAAVKKGVDLLESRINAVGEQYNRGMKTTADPVTLLSPQAQEVWRRLSDGPQPAQDPPSQSSTPVAASVDPAKVPAGQTFTYKGHTLKALGGGKFQQVQ
jgi:hypothetical protein